MKYMKRKPVIGLSGSRIRMEGGYLTGMEKSLVNSDYLDAILRVGGLPVIIPPTATAAEIDDYLEMCDGILMTGGMDVAPILYNEMPHPRCGNFDLEVDRSNLLLAQKAMDSGKPVLGICRGMQLMNIAKGGTLYQDIPSQTTGTTGHSYGYIRTDVVHKVHVKDSSYLREIFGTDELEVNSIHHQAVKDVGKDFTVTVTAPDGIVEGIEIPGKPIFAVQWHPEMLLKGSDKMLCIFEAFIKLCGN